MNSNIDFMIRAPQSRVAAETNPYLENFERLEKNRLADTPSWVFPIRKAGISRFAELGFPTLKDEDWRFTNMAPVAKLPFRPVFDYSRAGITSQALGTFTFAGLQAHRLVFINGHYSEEFSKILPHKKGVRITNLANALSTDSDLIEKHLANHASTEKNAFAALNTAFFHDGAFLFVPSDTTIEEPIHLLFVSTANEPGVTSHPRNLIIAEKGSRLTVLESYASTVDAAYLTNAVTEVVAGEGAAVEHCKYQDESLSAFHVATLHADLGRNCNFTSHSMITGARLSRNNIRTALNGEGIECILNGLYLTKGDQLADHHMIVEHAKAHCNSHEYFNGILDGRSRGVFHGRILVQPEAQKTDAKQTNKNLLLSDDATIDTKPQLEIYADDVKCTHGATIGQLNEESIFYLRSRGIGIETARRMLIHAFAGEIIDRIKCRAAREELDNLFWDRLEQNPQIAEKR
jgi:Fe-S cluster assembly protein SufD